MKIKLKGAYANPATASPAASTSAEASSTPGYPTPPQLNGQAASHSATPSYPHLQTRPPFPHQQQQQQQPQQAVPSPAHNDTDDQARSPSTSSSQADDAFLNAPLDLPESSGDEYEDPRLPGRPMNSRKRRKHFASTSPRPSRQRRGSSRQTRPSRHSRGPEEQDDYDNEDDQVNDNEEQEDYDDDDDDDEPVKVVASSPRKPSQQQATGGPKKRGRPPLPRDAMGNIIKTGNSNKGKGRSEDEGTPGLGGDDSLGDGDDSNLVFDDDDDEDDGSALQSGMSTPGGSTMPTGSGRRRGGAGGVMFGSDGRKRGGAVSGGIKSKQVKGRVYPVEIDELALPIDEEGEKKVNVLGQLQRGREYKAPTFTSSSRASPDRLYMLAIDAARCAGFRDSLYFFRRNPLIHKLNCSQEEKEMLIAKGRLHINLKSRQVTIVTARNCYRIFGARFIKNGKNVTDDYYESAALARGMQPGTPAYVESYDPEIDNTTLAMPKVGNFAKPLGAGRPAYMKIARAFEFLQAPLGSAPPDGKEERERLQEKERLKRLKEEEEEEAADAAGFNGGKKSAFRLLKIPTASGYKAIEFGLVNGAPGPQFSGNGIPPFSDSWEKSKARKPAPFLNGYNWMLEFAKITSRNNSAILGVRREYNAYHGMTLGGTGKETVKEEQEGVWEMSGDEEDYETMEEYRRREGLEEKVEEGEEDDRKRGRTPEPSAYALDGSRERPSGGVKAEAADDNDNAMDLDADQTKTISNSTIHPDNQATTGNSELSTTKKRRRRRSPIRGFYESHTRAPQVRLDTQPSTVLEYEKIDLVPYFALEDGQGADELHLKRAAALGGVASVEYLMRRA